jgi:sugar lactone lactonase YvrE
MAKVYGQNIPSVVQEDLSKILINARYTGWNYYIETYNYGYVGLVQKVPKDFLYRWGGATNPYLSDKAQKNRWVWKRIDLMFRDQHRSIGVEPPYTGARSRKWWYESKDPGSLSYVGDFYNESYPYAKAQYRPPWAIEPDIWIVDKDNSRIVQRNINTFGFTRKVGSYGSGNSQFDNPYGIDVDRKYIYVADSVNKRICVFWKDTLGWVKEIKNFVGGPGSFQKPVDVKVDDSYMYVADMDAGVVIVLRKDVANYYNFLDLPFALDAKTKMPTGLALDNTYIYIADNNNSNMKIYFRETQLSITTIFSEGSGAGQLQNPNSIDSDEQAVYIADTGNNRIVIVYKPYWHSFTTIGPGQDYDVPLSAPYGVCVSGDFLIVIDSGNDRLVRFQKKDLTKYDFYGITGVGDDQFNNPKGIKADLSWWYTPTGA